MVLTRSDLLEEGLTEQWLGAPPAPRSTSGTALLPMPRLWLGASPLQKKFTLSCSSSVSGIMANHNTHLAPGFTLNNLVLAPAGVVVLQDPLGLLPVESPTSRGTASHHVAQRPPGLHSAPGDSPFPPAQPGIELRRFRVCTHPVYTVLMEFKPSPFSFLPF